MKKFKKFFAVLLTLAMVLGMSMTTFAAPKTTTITVNGLKSGATISYVKLVNNKVNGGWEVNSSLPDALKTQLETIIGQDNTLDDHAKNGTINNALKNLDFAGVQTISTNVQGNVIKDVEAGLYAIRAVDGTNEYAYSWMIAYVGYATNGDLTAVKVQAKGESSKIEKTVVNKDSVSPDDEVNFEIKVKYPKFTTKPNLAANDVAFEINDNVTGGTIKGGSLTIKVDNQDVTNAVGLTSNEYADTANLHLYLASYDNYKDIYAGKELIITYTVKVDSADADSAVADNGLKNKATSSVVGADGQHKETQSIVVLPSLSVTIKKISDDETPVALSGAVFGLYVKNANGGFIKVGESSEPTDANGFTTFKGLSTDKEYYVKEEVAPEGYSLIEEYKPLTGAEVEKKYDMDLAANAPIPETDETVAVATKYIKYEVTTGYQSVGFGTSANEDESVDFKDSKLGALPSTGGIGTTIFTIGGCAIMIIAAGLFFASRRRSAK